MSKEIQLHITKLYKVDKLLGSGAYGHVWKVEDKSTGQVLALKKIFDAFQNSTDAQRTYRQITVLDQLSHQNIVKIKRVIRSANNKDLYLVFEHMEADLHSIVGQNILEPVHQQFIAYQIFKALKYIHSADLIHRDLKPSNVLINSQCSVKLCDFGLVRSLIKYQDEEIILSEEVATRWYRSPQVLLGCSSYGKPTDMWSVGCILVEMLVGQPLFPGKSTLDQLERMVSWTGIPSREDIDSLQNLDIDHLLRQVSVKTDYKRQILECIPTEFVDLINSLLIFNPKKRPRVEDCLKLSVFQSFHNPDDEPVCPRKVVLPINDNIQLELRNYRDIIYSDINKRYPQNNKIKIYKRSTSNTKKKSFQQTKSQQKNSFIEKRKDSFKGSSTSFKVRNSAKVLPGLYKCQSPSSKKLFGVGLVKNKSYDKKKPVKIQKTSTAALLLRNKSKQSLFSKKQSHKRLLKFQNKIKSPEKHKPFGLDKSRSKGKKDQFTSSTTTFEDKKKHYNLKYAL